MRRVQGRLVNGAEKPAEEFDLEARRHNELSPPSWMASTRRRFSHKGASFGAARKERNHGDRSAALRRTGCTQEKRVRLHHLLRSSRGETGEATFWNHDPGLAASGRLAETASGHACG